MLSPLFKEKTVKIDGRDVFYIESGQGRPLVMIHSWPTCNRIFEELMNFFPKGYHLIAPDLPGFGLSQEIKGFRCLDDFVDFLDKFLNLLKIRKTDLLGVSVGGVICLKYAISKPNKVKKIVAVSTPICVKKMLSDLQRKLVFSLDSPEIINLVLAFMRSDLYYWLYTRVDFPDILENDLGDAEGIVKNIFAQARNSDNTTVAKTIFSLIKTDLRLGLRRSSWQTLFIVGEKDIPKMVKQLEEFCQKADKRMNLIKIPKGTHRLIINNAQEVAKIVSDFLKKGLKEVVT